jgi:hypothetical protein
MLLNEGRGPRHPERRPFHWALEFPEVFAGERRGFDAFVGNPPFLGGKRITTVLGEHYTFALKQFTSDRKGAADISAHFLVRAFVLAASPGTVGLLLTNSINEGDTREIGLGEVLRRSGRIYRAATNRPWPFGAGITISTVFVSKGPFRGPVTLDDVDVDYVSEYLTSGAACGEPRRMAANKGIASIGTYVNGSGFVIDEATRDAFVHRDLRNAHVLFRYLTSQDINQRPTSDPSRFVIDFGDMPRERAESYRLPFAHVVQYVKPARDKLARQIHETCFWKHWDRREEFYARLRRLRRALVLGRVSTYHAVTFMNTDWIAFDGVVVFSWEDFGHFALLQSSIHEAWAARFRTSLREDPRYSVSDCFLTFPLPDRKAIGRVCEEPGGIYFNVRARLMLVRSQGLTGTYHGLHDETDTTHETRNLRECQGEMDKAVAAAYGWTDIRLDHGFHATPQGRRFTIGDPVRREILARLLCLNHQRYTEEVTAGLHDKDKKKPRPPKPI